MREEAATPECHLEGHSGHDWRLFALLMAAAALPRLIILVSSQRWLRSDEALVGLMAKHIITRGERVVFLYGQSYGGGHAILAWLLAPLSWAFGPSGLLVNGAAMVVSLANVAVLWFVLSRPGRMNRFQVVIATALYAIAPAIVYQSFLANGGNIASLFGLLSLHFFLRVGPEESRTFRSGLFLGLTCGLAYYAMDYAAVYVLTYALLVLLLWRPVLRSQALGGAATGWLVGVSPLLAYNLTHDWAHVRQMFLAPAMPIPPLVQRFPRALYDFFTRDGAVLFGTHLDDFPAAVPTGAAVHFAVFLVAVLFFALNRRHWRTRRVETICLTAVAVHLFLYGVSKYSAEAFRTPRYYLPLYPFAAILTAHLLQQLIISKRSATRGLAVVLMAFLVLQSLFEASKMVSATAHREHNILTSGPSITALADRLRSRRLRRAIAPYEIQARLIAATNEEVIATCFYISPLPRYAPYDVGALLDIAGGRVDWACVFRRDFAFAGLGPARLSRSLWERELAAERIAYRIDEVGEFVVYHGFSSVPSFVERMAKLAAERQKETARPNGTGAR